MSSPPKMKTSVVIPCTTMRGHTDYVYGVAHLPGGKRIITCSADGSLRLWDLESGAQIGGEWRDEGDKAGIKTMALSPNGKILASGSDDGTVSLWNIEMGKVVLKWKAEGVRLVCWSPDGERVNTVSGSRDGPTVRVWDVKLVKSGEPLQSLNPIGTGHRHVFAVNYSPEAKMIATGGHNEGIKIWDAKTCRLLSKIELDRYRSVYSLAWTSDEKRLIAGLIGSIRIFDTATWQQIAVLDGHSQEWSVNSLTLFPNDRFLASTSFDQTVRLWNLDTNLQVGPPLQHENYVKCAAFSADGKLLSTACNDNNAYVWDIYAFLKAAGLEDLLSDVSTNLTRTRYLISNECQAQNSELKKNVSIISWLSKNETR
jgi:WD40 repeat protein